MRAMLSLMGMYEYDNTILDFFHYPDKWETVDKDVFVNKLLLDTAELEVLYPDADIFKTAIKYWWRQRCRTGINCMIQRF